MSSMSVTASIQQPTPHNTSHSWYIHHIHLSHLGSPMEPTWSLRKFTKTIEQHITDFI